MALDNLRFLDHHRSFTDRLILSCEKDKRVAALFLVGSYAKGKADAWSDIDFCAVTLDDSYEDFLADRRAFFGQLGELVFLEDFDIPGMIYYIYSDDTEGELVVGRESKVDHIFDAPYEVLLDKKNLAVHIASPKVAAADLQEQQTEKLRREITWFWHDLSHFITAMRREQLWWARGQLDVLRPMCVNLARLRHNFSDPVTGEEAYSKVEQALPVERLAALHETFCPMDKAEMLKAVRVIVSFYLRLAPGLAEDHGITYPTGLEKVMIARLNTLN